MKLPDNVVLKSGAHKSFEDGYCAMELVSYLAKSAARKEIVTLSLHYLDEILNIK